MKIIGTIVILSSQLNACNGLETNTILVKSCLESQEMIQLEGEKYSAIQYRDLQNNVNKTLYSSSNNKACDIFEDDDKDWADLNPKCQQEYITQGWTEMLWEYEPEEEEAGELDWNELPEHRKRHFELMGWDEDSWELKDFSKVNVYDLEWDMLSTLRQDALKVLGWTEEDWRSMTEIGVMPFHEEYRADSKAWEDLNENERRAVIDLGFNESTWHKMDIEEATKEFNPIFLNIQIPTLNQFDFEYFKSLDLNVQVRDGSVIGDDEYSARWVMKLAEYLDLMLNHNSTLYLKYEDGEEFQKIMHKLIGKQVLSAFFDTLWKKTNMIKPEWDHYPLSDINWSFWLGSRGTSTSLHYDMDTFNFLWVLKGRKRIVIMPYNEETSQKYSCKVFVEGHSCWPEVDILQTHEKLPDYAIEYEIGPNQGISIPRYAWHAVENLEPTIAFGFRIEDFLA